MHLKYSKSRPPCALPAALVVVIVLGLSAALQPSRGGQRSRLPGPGTARADVAFDRTFLPARALDGDPMPGRPFAADRIPPALVEQLKPGGRMLIPVDSLPLHQNVVLIEKDADGTVRTHPLTVSLYASLPPQKPSGR
jgi:hypothetical protein